jgi:hypothetical protein
MSLVDITILDCSESHFRATEWLELDRTVLKKAMTVDLIGYPGDYTLTYARKTQGLDPRFEKSEYRDIEDLLPKYELTVTHGTVITGGGMPSYRVSTIGGMSGSPIIVNGKVIGTHSWLDVCFADCKGCIQDVIEWGIIAVWHFLITLLGSFWRTTGSVLLLRIRC